MKSPFIYLFILLLAGFSAVADPKDSLENVLKTAKGELRVKTLNELCRAYLNSDPVKATGYTSSALMLATEINDEKGMAAANNNLGVAYKSQGALDKALGYYLISLKIYDKIQNKEGIATAQNNIGTIYSMKKDFSQAMKYFELSYQAFKELGDQVKIIGSLNNLGVLHSDLQLYEQARKYFMESLELSKKAGKQSSDPLNNIGNLYFRQGNYQEAVKYYEEAIGLSKVENNDLTTLHIIANLGEVYSRMGQSAKAQVFLQNALQMSRDMQATIFEPTILKSLSGNYAKEGKMKEAYDLMLQYDAMREKIYGDESSRKIAQMEMALDLHDSEKEVEQLKKTEEITNLQLKNTRMVIATIIMAVVLLVAMFNIFFSKRRSIK